MKTNFLASTIGRVGKAALGCPVEQSSTGFGAAAATAEGKMPSGQPARRRRYEKKQARAWMITRLKSTWEILTGTLREIFDESAYERFLKQRRLSPSRAAYTAFRQENEVTKAHRPRCC
jgi:hypothetical protein